MSCLLRAEFNFIGYWLFTILYDRAISYYSSVEPVVGAFNFAFEIYNKK